MRPDDLRAFVVAAVFFVLFAALTVVAARQAMRARHDPLLFQSRMLPLALGCICTWLSVGMMILIRSIYW